MAILGTVQASIQEKTRVRWLAAACFFLFLFIYSFTSRASVVSSDEVAVLGTSVNLATLHVLHIDNLAQVDRITDIGEKGKDKHFYTKYFPGNVIAAAVIYRLAAKTDDTPYVWTNPKYGSFTLAPSEQGARIALRLNALLGAIGMTMLFMVVVRLFDWRVALFTVLLLGLTTDWWYESRIFFSEIGAGTFLIASLYFSAHEKPYLSSASFALSLLFRPTNLLALPVWVFSVWKRNYKAWLSGIFLLASLALLVLYNYVRFQSVLDFGYRDDGFHTPLWQGLTGLFVSPGHSMFLYSLITLLAIPGGFLLYKQNKYIAFLSLFCVVGYILMAASWYSWFGGKVWGSRLIVPILPLMGLLIAPVINQVFVGRSPVLLAFVLLLGVAGLGIQLLTIIQNPMIAYSELVDSGYATQWDVIWSLDKNWLALEIKSLVNWTTCNIDAYSLRMLFSACQ